MRRLIVEYTVQVRIPVEVNDNEHIDALAGAALDEASDIIGAALEVYGIDYELPESNYVVYDENFSIIKDGNEE